MENMSQDPDNNSVDITDVEYMQPAAASVGGSNENLFGTMTGDDIGFVAPG